jgi:hypothetical protein
MIASRSALDGDDDVGPAIYDVESTGRASCLAFCPRPRINLRLSDPSARFSGQLGPDHAVKSMESDLVLVNERAQSRRPRRGDRNLDRRPRSKWSSNSCHCDRLPLQPAASLFRTQRRYNQRLLQLIEVEDHLLQSGPRASCSG